MKKLLLLIIFLISAVLIKPLPALSESLAVFVNSKNPIQKLTVDDLKKIYQDEMARWPNGNRISAYDQSLKSKFRATFSEKVIGKRAEKVEEDWANKKITNTAINPPIVVKNPMLTIIKVSNDIDAIGYLPASLVKDEKGVRIILVID